MKIFNKQEQAKMRQLFKHAEQRMLSRNFTLFVFVIAVLGLAGSLAAMLPVFQNAAMGFAEAILVHRPINHEVWRTILFSAAIVLVSVSAIAIAFMVSIENPAMKTAQIPLTAALLFIIMVYIALITYYYGHYWLNSDSAAELLGAKTLAEENALFSPKWYYGTEFWLIYRQPFAILLFKIFNDWPLIRAINVFLMLLVLTLAFLFMMRQTKIPFKYSLLACCFLTVPLSHPYWRDTLFEHYYTLFFIKIFLMSGCFLSFLNQTKKSFAGTVRAVLFYALAFLTGTEGIRIFYNFLMPLALTVFAAAYFDVIKEKKTAYKAVIMAIVFSFIGYLVNTKLLRNIFSFATWYDFTSLDGFGAGFFDKFSGILFNVYAVFFGYTSSSVLHRDGFLSMASLLFFVLSIAGFTFLLKNSFTGSKKPFFAEMCRMCSGGYFLLLYTAVSLIFNFVFFLFIIHSPVPRYFFAALIFLFAAFPVFINFIRTKRRGIHLFLWIGVFAFLFGHGTLIFHRNTQPYANENARRSGYLSFLEKKSLSYGFASYWNANVTAELSNGRVEMVTLSDTYYGGIGRELLRYKWLSPVKFDNPYYHRGEAFLLLSKDEWEARKESSVFTEKTPAYQDDFFAVFVYPEAAAIHREIMREIF
jgi:hypothetical protein